jgi:hypothetical protein
MKHILTVFIFTAFLISCNSSDKTKTTTQEASSTEATTESTSKDINKNFKSIETDEDLVATSLMAAPEFIVLADNPTKDGFNAACYHKNLEPFMARGRALRAEGKSAEEIFAIREEEMKSGQLKITPGSTLHIYYGPNTMYDPETAAVDGAQMRYVTYIPWATSETIGIPEAPTAPNHPWLMNAGTHRAHIMLSPLPKDKE